MADDDKTKDGLTDDDKTKTSLKDDPEFKAMKEMVGTLGQLVTQSQSQSAALNDKLDGLVDTLKKKAAPEKPAGPSDDDLNSMSQSEMTVHILKSVQGMISDSVKPIQEQTSSTKDDMLRSNVATSLKAFAKDHPDIVELGKEITTIIDDSPGISVERAYSLARLENPDKASELDKKYYDKTDEEATQKFGGLMPTSTVTVEGADEPEKLTQQEASDKAWEDVVQEFPAIALGEN